MYVKEKESVSVEVLGCSNNSMNSDICENVCDYHLSNKWQPSTRHVPSAMSFGKEIDSSVVTISRKTL